ncbi:MAG: N-methyl-L-tryptophan oxidase [Candidatus Heimdallarchaeota archaeon]|nr:N-methyl-L-tryptophan oxidase [Candidatus Heimdallarchaeota archaeon]
MDHYDVIIIGAGAMGSATAYYLSKTKKRVLLLEQFHFLHKNGSSHGESRIIRRAYPEKHFADLMFHTYDLWQEIEKETGESIIYTTGGLDFGDQDNEQVKSVEDACKSVGLNYEKMDSIQLRERYPILNIPDNYTGIYQPDAGIINATKAVSMFQELAKQNGVTLIDNFKVKHINVTDSNIEIVFNSDNYTCDKLIITAGAWINSILGLFDKKIQLNIDIWKLTIAYWKVKNRTAYKPPSFPVFINWAEDHFYGFPIFEREDFIKVGPHFKFETIDNIETKNIEPNAEVAELLTNYIQTRFREIDADPIDLQSCLYTMTEDENFIVDFHPNYSKIIIGAGFSGHGFKFTPLIGKMLSQMAINETTSYDRSKFDIISKINQS